MRWSAHSLEHSLIREATPCILQQVVAKYLWLLLINIVFSNPGKFLSLINNRSKISRSFTFGNRKLSSFCDISSDFINWTRDILLLLLKHGNVVSWWLAWGFLRDGENSWLVQVRVIVYVVIAFYTPFIVALFRRVDHVLDGNFPRSLGESHAAC